jgi:hypothetical protein
VSSDAQTAAEVPFGPWRAELREALDGQGDADVPCGGCTACCRSGQFVHVEADEADALAHIPPELLFPAPGSPAGSLLVGYDEDGRCPLLGAGGCSIYEHRPRTCRSYDCRLFAAAGVTPDQPAVASAAGRWSFTVAGGDERSHLDGLRRAARFLAAHPEVWPRGLAPGATGRALAALAVAELFPGDGLAGEGEPAVDVVRDRLARGRS